MGFVSWLFGFSGKKMANNVLTAEMSVTSDYKSDGAF